MKLRTAIFCLVMIVCQRLQAQVNPDVINYVNTYKALAMSEMQRSGIPASIILAQGIHETEAGTSDLVRSSNNHFGIKCRDEWKGPVVYHDDDSKGECFRSYASAEDSYKDHSAFLRNSPRYAFLFKLDPTDYEGWAYGLRKAGYATNIRYSQILIKLINDYNLEQYTLIAMGKLKSSDEIVLTAPSTGTPVGSSPAAVAVNQRADGNAQAMQSQAVAVSHPAYPEGEFLVNKTRVIFARAGISLLAVANQYELPLGRLLEFNDLREEDILVKDQLLFLQRKRRTGATEYHIVQSGESVYDICQTEGIRYQDLLEMNQLSTGDQPATGEKVYLQSSAPSRPRLVAASGTTGGNQPAEGLVIHRN